MRTLLLICSIALLHIVGAQPTSKQLFQNFSLRNIGPANQGGRIVDIEALNQDFTKVWIATGSGGVWYSDNAGTTWSSIFDDYETASIGDIAINQQDPQIIWVGTGEANNRNSVSWGNGMYKSVDGGKTFRHLGLASTHQISRVVLHPEDDKIAYVAAIGHLWGNSGERGLFHTEDGGQSWTKMTDGLPDDGKTGCTDLVMDPTDPDVLYAAFYERLRQPWHFESGGRQGGIFKSINGGETWKKLTSGLPAGLTGRIGLAIYSQNPNILMALVEAPRSNSLDTLGSGLYRTEDAGASWTYVNTYNNRPFYYSQVRINPHDDQRVYLLTTRFMVSEDGGKTLQNGSSDEEVHGDFHALWIDPQNPDRYYLGADKGLSLTHDHGSAFTLIDNLPIAQFYRINVDMRDPYYVYGGLQDNGMYGVASFARDARGILNDHNWKLHWGDGQFINPDPTNWRRVYTSMENGSIFHYNAKTYEIGRISPTPDRIRNYTQLIEDSLQYTGREFRFNWTAPFHMSPFDPNTLYLAGNHVFKSGDRGNTWEIISPDLSTNHPIKSKKGVSGGITPDNSGAETHCAAYSMALSPIDPRLIWIGTDDGMVQVTRDGGQNWNNVRALIPTVPEGTWVSRIEASPHDPREAFITFDGHRSDSNRPWIFKAEQYGQKWSNLTANLPGNEVVRVIRQDLHNPNLLFIGTETGVWASINGGEQWSRFHQGLPTVSVYDLKIHPRDGDLVVGTHGRSIWIADDITPLQQFNEDVQRQPAWLFRPRVATLWENTSRGGQRGHFWYAGENPPVIENASSLPRAQFQNKAMLSYYIKEQLTDPAILEISDAQGKFMRRDTLANTAGIHRYMWDLEFDADWLSPADSATISNTFRELTTRYSSSRLRAAAQRFHTANSPREQRTTVDLLTRGYLSLPLSKEMGIPRAEPGVYVIKMTAGTEEHLRSLIIRKDPLHDDG